MHGKKQICHVFFIRHVKAPLHAAKTVIVEDAANISLRLRHALGVVLLRVSDDQIKCDGKH